MHICEFPGSIAIGKPKGWVEELDGPCYPIYVTATVDVQTGHTVLYSVYKPTDEEIEELKAGGVIRLGVVGKTHPVFQLGVLSKELAASAQLEPKWDLGPIIRSNG